MASGGHSHGVIKMKDGTFKFPVDTKGEARNAMARMNQAKPKLKLSQKKKIARAVERKLGHSTEKTRQILGSS